MRFSNEPDRPRDYYRGESPEALDQGENRSHPAMEQVMDAWG
jgi:hypothetical protein